MTPQLGVNGANQFHRACIRTILATDRTRSSRTTSDLLTISSYVERWDRFDEGLSLQDLSPCPSLGRTEHTLRDVGTPGFCPKIESR